MVDVVDGIAATLQEKRSQYPGIALSECFVDRFGFQWEMPPQRGITMYDNLKGFTCYCRSFSEVLAYFGDELSSDWRMERARVGEDEEAASRRCIIQFSHQHGNSSSCKYSNIVVRLRACRIVIEGHEYGEVGV